MRSRAYADSHSEEGKKVTYGKRNFNSGWVRSRGVQISLMQWLVQTFPTVSTQVQTLSHTRTIVWTNGRVDSLQLAVRVWARWSHMTRRHSSHVTSACWCHRRTIKRCCAAASELVHAAAVPQCMCLIHSFHPNIKQWFISSADLFASVFRKQEIFAG